MNNKRFYWIKLHSNFMISDSVDFLMSQKNGAEYVVLYQKLCFMAINTGGELARTIGEIIMPYDAEKIQRDCKHFSLDTVIVALELYKKLGLIYEQGNGILKIADYDKMVGSETRQAGIMRNKRQKIKEQEYAKIGNNVTKKLQKSYTDIDIENRDKEQDKDTYNNIKKEKKDTKKEKTTVNHSSLVFNVVSYLNEKAGTRFSDKSASTVGHINGRASDGYTLDDFKAVIDNRVVVWLSDKEMRQYIRPNTLFTPTNFENYLNAEKLEVAERSRKSKAEQADAEKIQRDIEASKRSAINARLSQDPQYREAERTYKRSVLQLSKGEISEAEYEQVKAKFEAFKEKKIKAVED